MDNYGWAQLSQWDIPPIDAYVESKTIETGLSKATCSFMLVKRIDQGGGYMRSEYVKEQDVSQSILNEAGKF